VAKDSWANRLAARQPTTTAVGAVQVDGVTLENNQQSQVLIDSGATGLAVTGGTVAPKAGQLGIVVQRTTPMVSAPR
jgi:hypothetical protein